MICAPSTLGQRICDRSHFQINFFPFPQGFHSPTYAYFIERFFIIYEIIQFVHTYTMKSVPKKQFYTELVPCFS